MPDDRFISYLHSLGEYYVHTQDVARPNGIEQPAPDETLENALWQRAGQAARILHRRRTPGLVLEWAGGPSRKVTPGAPRTRVTGRPSEIICWVYGRPCDAEVVTHQ